MDIFINFPSAYRGLYCVAQSSTRRLYRICYNVKSQIEKQNKAQKPIISHMYYFVAKPLTLKLNGANDNTVPLLRRTLFLQVETHKFTGVKQLATPKHCESSLKQGDNPNLLFTGQLSTPMVSPNCLVYFPRLSLYSIR